MIYSWDRLPACLLHPWDWAENGHATVPKNGLFQPTAADPTRQGLPLPWDGICGR